MTIERLSWPPVCWWPMFLGPWPIKAEGARRVRVIVWFCFYISVFS